MPTTCRIIIADDHVPVRDSVKAMLAHCTGFSVTGEAGDGLELLDLLKKQVPEPDVAIVDLGMPRLGGLDAIREIRRTTRKLRILVLTLHKEEELLCRAFFEGADGYLLKDDLATELLTALGGILAGETYVSPGAAKHVENTWLKVFIATKDSPAFRELSVLELEILELLAKGESDFGIARNLHISSRAAGQGRADIIRKLHLKKEAALLR